MDSSPALRADATAVRRLQAGLGLIAGVQDAFAAVVYAGKEVIAQARLVHQLLCKCSVHCIEVAKRVPLLLSTTNLARLFVAMPNSLWTGLIQSVQPVGCCPGSSVLPCRRYAEACELRGTSGHSSASGLW